MNEIRLEYFFLPIYLQLQSNPGSEDVVVDQRTILGTFEFLRLPVQAAFHFAALLEQGADNASSTPVVDGDVGEISGIFVRKLGTGSIRVGLSVKRAGSIRLAIYTTVGRKRHRSRPKISVSEARRFATFLRQANAN
ncbi:hypothetical protein Poly51_26320 [Rubripirellula tenax]|uniref:Uncharacterized protein n=1 Tax=Rubripirellula tenax TaxID=2528015 RepID=A0A5C6F647_9BACT|nr:hypothetical protein [Rubripirellula tenax]TWU56715.1 hypothetical protein Poly51_26320 [Rubripirellula tenax]